MSFPNKFDDFLKFFFKKTNKNNHFSIFTSLQRKFFIDKLMSFYEERGLLKYEDLTKLDDFFLAWLFYKSFVLPFLQEDISISKKPLENLLGLRNFKSDSFFFYDTEFNNLQNNHINFLSVNNTIDDFNCIFIKNALLLHDYTKDNLYGNAKFIIDISLDTIVKDSALVESKRKTGRVNVLLKKNPVHQHHDFIYKKRHNFLNFHAVLKKKNKKIKNDLTSFFFFFNSFSEFESFEIGKTKYTSGYFSDSFVVSDSATIEEVENIMDTQTELMDEHFPQAPTPPGEVYYEEYGSDHIFFDSYFQHFLELDKKRIKHYKSLNDFEFLKLQYLNKLFDSNLNSVYAALCDFDFGFFDLNKSQKNMITFTNINFCLKNTNSVFFEFFLFNHIMFAYVDLEQKFNFFLSFKFIATEFYNTYTLFSMYSLNRRPMVNKTFAMQFFFLLKHVYWFCLPTVKNYRYSFFIQFFQIIPKLIIPLLLSLINILFYCYTFSVFFAYILRYLLRDVFTFVSVIIHNLLTHKIVKNFFVNTLHLDGFYKYLILVFRFFNHYITGFLLRFPDTFSEYFFLKYINVCHYLFFSIINFLCG